MLSGFVVLLTDINFSTLGSSLHGPSAHGHTSQFATTELAGIVSLLISSSLQPSSLPTYKRAWNLFYNFFHTTFPGLPVVLPISAPNLALFIAYLFDRHYACSTVNTYISALSYSHKLLGFSDTSKVFFIVQMLKGYGKLSARVDVRLPITLPILHKILTLSPDISLSGYELCLFRAMCSLAFHACLRVGEMVVTNNTNPVLSFADVTQLFDASNNVISLRVTFRDYKHSYNQDHVSIIVQRQNTFCPVNILLEYISKRGTNPGPLFLLNGLPVQRQYFCGLLTMAIRLCGLDPTRYKGHSFRIGAASHAAERGLSDARIRSMGRWKSNAFLRYIRIQGMSA